MRSTGTDVAVTVTITNRHSYWSWQRIAAVTPTAVLLLWMYNLLWLVAAVGVGCALLWLCRRAAEGTAPARARYR